MTSKTLIKHDAQSDLLSAMQQAFDRLDENDSHYAERVVEMSKQMARVEKLFGFDEYSFSRGA